MYKHNIGQVQSLPQPSGHSHARSYYTLEDKQLLTLAKFTQFLWPTLLMLEGMMGVRIILKFIAANPANLLVHFVYAITTPFVTPFFGLTVNPASNGVVVEISSVIAVFAYALIALLIERTLWIVLNQSRVWGKRDAGSKWPVA